MKHFVVNPQHDLRGRKAQRNGAGFENLFQSHAKRAGMLCIRFPDGCRRVRGLGGKPRLLPVKTPFDWILSVPGLSGYLDTKSTGGVAFAYNQVSEHQIQTLSALERLGHVAGYVVYFQNSNVVVFFRASQLEALNPRESLRPEMGLGLGTVFEMRLERLFESKPIRMDVRESDSKP